MTLNQNFFIADFRKTPEVSWGKIFTHKLKIGGNYFIIKVTFKTLSLQIWHSVLNFPYSPEKMFL